MKGSGFKVQGSKVDKVESESEQYIHQNNSLFKVFRQSNPER